MCINNPGFFEEIAARMIPCLCDLSNFKSNIISKDNGKHKSDNEDKNNYRLSADNNLVSKLILFNVFQWLI